MVGRFGSAICFASVVTTSPGLGKNVDHQPVEEVPEVGPLHAERGTHGTVRTVGADHVGRPDGFVLRVRRTGQGDVDAEVVLSEYCGRRAADGR